MKQTRKTPRQADPQRGQTPLKKSTIVLIAAAGVLLLGSAVGSASAALTYYSENYTAQVEISHIGVTLTETSAQGTKDISSRDYTGSGDLWSETQGELLEDMLAESDDKLVLGRKYTEQLAVKNSGNIDEYVRVRVFKGWTDKDGNKEMTLAPSLIILNMTQNGWLVDESASTEERTVLYWPRILAVGETTAPLADSLTIDSSIASKVTETTKTENGVTTTATTFAYDGVQFYLEAEVDAVQTHNAADAIKSAWGVDVNVSSDGTISLR